MTKYVTPFAMLFVILYALSDTIVGTFALNSIPESNYILYPIILGLIPIFILLISLTIAVVYFKDKKSSNKIQQ